MVNFLEVKTIVIDVLDIDLDHASTINDSTDLVLELFVNEQNRLDLRDAFNEAFDISINLDDLNGADKFGELLDVINRAQGEC